MTDAEKVADAIASYITIRTGDYRPTTEEAIETYDDLVRALTVALTKGKEGT